MKQHVRIKFKDTESEKIKIDIIVNCNIKIVTYHYVTLNLNNGSYHPFKKPNEETNDIHVNSDHSPRVLK